MLTGRLLITLSSVLLEPPPSYLLIQCAADPYLSCDLFHG